MTNEAGGRKEAVHDEPTSNLELKRCAGHVELHHDEDYVDCTDDGPGNEACMACWIADRAIDLLLQLVDPMTELLVW